MSSVLFATDAAGRLLVEPPPSVSRVVSLRFDPDGVVVSSPASHPVTLGWDAYRTGPTAALNLTSPATQQTADGWTITYWREQLPAGLAVQLGGAYAEASRDLLAATSTFLRKHTNWIGIENRLPVLPRTTVASNCSKERGTLDALCAVLSDQPGLRARLAEPQRMKQLASDLASHLVAAPAEHTGFLRDSTDVIVALHQAGFAHRYGRPLRAGTLRDLDDVVQATRDQLQTNPHRVGRATDDDAIEKVIRAAYFDVAPWPFEALVSA